MFNCAELRSTAPRAPPLPWPSQVWDASASALSERASFAVPELLRATAAAWDPHHPEQCCVGGNDCSVVGIDLRAGGGAGAQTHRINAAHSQVGRTRR